MNWDLLNDAQPTAVLEAQQKRAKRVANCGRPGKQIEPSSGMYKAVHFYCGVHTQCERCLNYRAVQFRSELSRALVDDQQVHIYRMDADEADTFVRHMARLHYMRYPGAEQDTVVVRADVVQEFELEAGEVLSSTNVDSFDWQSIANTPEGRKISGNLDNIRKAPSTEGTTIRTFTLISGAPEDLTSQALRQSIEETEGLNPQTAEDLEEAIYRRMSRAMNLILEEGYAAVMHMSHAKLSPNIQLKWTEYARIYREARNPYYLQEQHDEQFGERVEISEEDVYYYEQVNGPPVEM